MCKNAAFAADEAGIDAGDETALLAWIKKNCTYRDETEFYLAFLIGCELANIQSRRRGYENNIHEALEKAKEKVRANP
jgi:hypothetical protein